MNKLFRMISLFVLLVGLSSPLRAQQLSDDQVIALVKEQKTAGKSDQEIGRLLVSRGVTREQLQRIKENYEKGQQSREDDPTPRTESRLRERRLVQNFMTTAATDSTGAGRRSSPTPRRRRAGSFRPSGASTVMTSSATAGCPSSPTRTWPPLRTTGWARATR